MKKRVFRQLGSMMLILMLFICGSIHSALAEGLCAAIDVDGGKWVKQYAEYLNSRVDEFAIPPRVSLLDLDLDGLPELVIVSEWDRWANGGYVVKISDAGIAEYYNPRLIDSGCDKIALAADSDGNLVWYQKCFQAGAGISESYVNRLSVAPDMELISEEWISYSEIEIYDEETGEIGSEVSGYYLDGEEIDQDEYLSAELERRKLRVLYTLDYTNQGFAYPDDWDMAVQQKSVLK